MLRTWAGSKLLLDKVTNLVSTSPSPLPLLRGCTAASQVQLETEPRTSNQGHIAHQTNDAMYPAMTGAEMNWTETLSVQDAYTPLGKCFGCGPANSYGLRLKSRRAEEGLEGFVTIPDRFQAFPGVVNGGVVTSLLECHGNWTAAIELMDKACLPRPPLTLTASISVAYKRPTPPSQPLVVRSQVVKIVDGGKVGLAKQAVGVEVQLYALQPNGLEDLLATVEGLFKRHGALRAL